MPARRYTFPAVQTALSIVETLRSGEGCSLGLRCVAAPIHDRTGTVVAAVSISGTTQRSTWETLHRLAAGIGDAGLGISRRLGHSTPRGARRKGGGTLFPKFGRADIRDSISLRKGRR